MHFDWGRNFQKYKVDSVAICLDFAEELLVIEEWDRMTEKTLQKLDLINHSDRQAERKPTLSRTTAGSLGNSFKKKI